MTLIEKGKRWIWDRAKWAKCVNNTFVTFGDLGPAKLFLLSTSVGGVCGEREPRRAAEHSTAGTTRNVETLPPGAKHAARCTALERWWCKDGRVP